MNVALNSFEAIKKTRPNHLNMAEQFHRDYKPEFTY